jgi:hypothetical protein
MPDNPIIKADLPKKGSFEDRLLSCGQGHHSRKLLFATTRFDFRLLQDHWLRMIAFADRAGIPSDMNDVRQYLLFNDKVSQVLFQAIESAAYQPGQQEERERAGATDAVTDETLKSYLTTQSHDSHDLPPEATEQFLCKYFTFYPFGPLAHCSMLLSYFIVRHHVVTIADLVLLLVKGSIQELVSTFVTQLLLLKIAK